MAFGLSSCQVNESPSGVTWNDRVAVTALEMCMQFVKMIQVVVMATKSNRGRKREILEKQRHNLVTVIIHNGRAVYYKNSVVLCLFAALHHFSLYVRAC